MLDKRKGPGAGGAEDPSKDDRAEHRSNSEKGDGSKVPSDFHEATDFLERLRPGGPWVLTAIHQTQNSIKTLTAHNASEVLDFVRAHDGKWNIYFSVNPTRAAMRTKASKLDIAAIEFIISDLDPRDDESPEDAKARYLKALGTFKPAATALIDSGDGIQALWHLETRIELAERVGETFPAENAAIIAEVEARSATLMKRLGSVAGTQNIDRILRLPGTTNLPNKKKIKAGRVACQARLISFNDSKYSLDAFPAPEPSGKGRKAGAGIDTLPISKRMKDLIRGIDDPDHPYASRSEAVYAVIVAMVGAGCADKQIETVFLDTNYAISAHVLEQSKSPEYLAWQIARAREIAWPRITRWSSSATRARS